MTQAAIYARISKDAAHDGLGVERQRSDCEALAGRLGWTVAATFTDDDRSAYSGKPRPAYRDLLAAIDSGSVGAVLAWHPDRLHRSPKELEGFIDLVERHGTAVQTVTAGIFDLSTPSGRMQARIVGAVARHESEHKSERLRRKMDELVAAGQPHVGPRPFGYRRILDAHGLPARPVAYEVAPAEAALILEAVGAILDDGRSMRSVLADWRARGIVTTMGNPWQPGPLKRMLCSAQLAGLRERHVDRDPKARAARKGEVELTETTVPAILPRARWQALRAILGDPARRTVRSTARVNLLAGFLHCGRPGCGKALVGRPRTDGVRRYVCLSKTLGGCGGLAILAAPTEAEVVARMVARLDNPTVREALAAETETSPTDPLGERAEAEARLAELAGDYAASRITRPEWQAARGILAERLAAVGPGTVRPTVRLPANVADAWPGLDLEARRHILADVVEKITVGACGRARGVFDPDRIVVKWREHE
jgi:DNA invertase Pin-like site-specific DNA recombinase